MPQHPLDPLSADEIREAAAIVRRERGVGERWRFASIELREPFKVVPGEVSGTGAPEAGADRAGQALHLRPEIVQLERSIGALDAQIDAARWRWAPT